MVGVDARSGVRIVGQTVDRAEVVRVAPVVSRIDPVGTVARLVVIVGLEASAAQRVAVSLDPCRIIVVLRMELRKVIDGTARTLVVRPLHLHAGSAWTVIGHGIILCRFRLTVFGAFQFVPCVVRQSVAVFVLHDPYDARFG